MQRFLQTGNGAEDAVLIWHEREIDVERRRTPAEEHGRGASGQERVSRRFGFRSKRAHERADAALVG
jgi:hypothetical protein